MGERSPGSGDALASVFRAKGHPPGINLQKTPIDGAENREGEVEAQVTGEQITDPGRGIGCWSRTAGEDSGHVDGGDRKKEEGTPGQENPGADREPDFVGRVQKKGDNRQMENRHKIERGNPWATKQGRKAQTSGGGWQAGMPSRWTVVLRPSKMMGGISGCKERDNWHRRVKDWG